MKREWRCKECDTLLGIEQGSRLHLRYKQAQYVLEGGVYSVLAICRTCSTVNEIERNEDWRPAAARA